MRRHLLLSLAALPLLAAGANAQECLHATLEGQAGTMPLVLEIADTPESQATGLMHRTDMPADHGMLFVFQQPGTWPFWMKNTPLPLDIAALDPNGRIQQIHTGVPYSTIEMPFSHPTKTVVELHAGTMARLEALPPQGQIVLHFDAECTLDTSLQKDRK